MRKISVLILIITISSISLKAQYKKATFFTKTGRTYELGANFHFLNKSATSLYYSAGSDKGLKRTFQWVELAVVLPSTYSYNTKAKSYDPSLPDMVDVTISGKTPVSGFYRYNYGIYLIDNTKGDKMFLPYIAFGANIFATFGITDDNYYSSGSYDDLEKVPAKTAFGGGINGGLGFIFNFSKKVGLRFAGGYDLQYNTTIDFSDNDSKSKYYFFKSHPYASVGVRLRIIKEGE